MSGLTTRQEWTHDHIVRCTCGAWMVVEDYTLTQMLKHGYRPYCPHAHHSETEAVA